MNERFDELSRAMAGGHSRRNVLKMFGAAAAAAAAASVLKPFRGDAASDCPAGTTPCGSTCCSSGIACVNASTSTCGCPSGQSLCGTGPNSCCTGTCSNPSTNCCCPKGTTPCGNACCAKGVACIDKANSVCGCPSGYTSCGTASNRTCCPAGQTCSSPNCAPVSGFTGPERVAKVCSLPGTCSGECCQGRNDSCTPNGSCYCDEACTSFSDCCSDFVDTCGSGAFVAPATATRRRS